MGLSRLTRFTKDGKMKMKIFKFLKAQGPKLFLKDKTVKGSAVLATTVIAKAVGIEIPTEPQVVELGAAIYTIVGLIHKIFKKYLLS